MPRLVTLGPNPTGKIIVHGHQITPLATIQRRIAEKQDVLPLDNGCYLGLYRSSGIRQRPDTVHLLCLDLDSFHLYIQPNVD